MATQASATSSGIRTSRPSIYVGGSEDTSLSQGLKYLSIKETVHGLFHCEARFGNWGPKGSKIDFLYFDRDKLDFGKAIQVKIDTDTVFDGSIFAIEADIREGSPHEITVLLEDRLQDLRMTRRTRAQKRGQLWLSDELQLAPFPVRTWPAALRQLELF